MSYIGKKPVDFNDVTEAQTFTVTGDLTVDTDTLFVDSTNNRVGIGTTSPQAGTGLHIKTGASGATPNGDLIIEDDANVKILLSCPAANTAQIHFGDDAANNVGKLEYIHSSNSMAFSTDATERMRIDSSGNVGIGVTPAAAEGSFLQFVDNYSIGRRGFGKNTYYDGSAYRAIVTGGATLIQGGDNFLFYTAPSVSAGATQSFTERMRIDSSGDLFIGCTASPSSSVLGAAFIDDGGGSKELRISSPVTTTDNVVLFYNPNGNVGRIQTFSSSTNYSTSSDYRLKENVTDITDGITRLKLLNPSRFNFIADADTTVDGFLAHEVSDIVPEAITGEKDAMKDEEYVATPATGEIYTPAQEATYDDDGNELAAAVDEIVHSTDVEQPDTLEEGRYWRETTQAVMATRSVPDYQGIDQSKLVPLLTAALQEAVAKIETLEARIVALENA